VTASWGAAAPGSRTLLRPGDQYGTR